MSSSTNHFEAQFSITLFSFWEGTLVSGDFYSFLQVMFLSWPNNQNKAKSSWNNLRSTIWYVRECANVSLEIWKLKCTLLFLSSKITVSYYYCRHMYSLVEITVVKPISHSCQSYIITYMKCIFLLICLLNSLT